MPLINIRDLSLTYGTHLRLENINVSIEPNERVCLLGRNGAGKSTLLKLIAKEIAPDAGIIEYQKELRLASLTQEVPQNTTGSVFTIVASGLEHHAKLLQDYFRLSHEMVNQPELFEEFSHVQNELENQNAWQLHQKVESVLSLMELQPEVEFSSLSGGLKRRVLLAKSLVRDPEILLLDEPTNHLDIAAITWLENFLLRFKGSVLFITHDRAFLQRLATRIVDLDRGHVTSWPCDYQTYLVRKEAALAAEANEWRIFDKKLAQEEVWIRQGIKARRTRNEGRVRELKQLREIRKQRREHVGKVTLQAQQAEKSGKIVITAEHVNLTYQDKTIIQNFSTVIMRGDKIGFIGPNGVGKTTLLRLLLNEIKPDSGTVQHGTQLSIAYYDQLRSALDENKTALDNVAGGSDSVTINGQSKHIMSYLQDFLFTPERTRTPVRSLSGGERNRLVLAKLFAKPCNVLVMDEPTNDLDIETLDLLEELLAEFSGTLLLVSHDREFLNNVVTSTIVFEDNQINEYIGGYDDWLRQRQTITTAPAVTEKLTKEITKKVSVKKLSHKEVRELTELPALIEKLENEIRQMQQAMLEPKFFQQSKESIQQAKQQISDTEIKLQTAYQRWEQLEGKE